MPHVLLLYAACAGGTVKVDPGRGEANPGDTASDSAGVDDEDSAPAPDSGEKADEPGCTLAASGDLHVDEGEEVALAITCDGVVPAGVSLELTDDLPDGALLDTAAWTLTWTPGLDQAGHYDLDFDADGAAAPLDVDLWVSDAFDDPDNTPVDPESYEEEDGLPVFHLDLSPEINSSYDTPGTLIYRGHTYAIEAQKRGAASLYYPQNSYTIEFSEDDKFDDDQVGWGRTEDLILQTTFDDNTYYRNNFTYWLWGALDEENLSPRTFFGVVYLEGEFHGLYQVIERVNDEFFEERELSHDGDLFKAVNHNANFYATDVYGSRKSVLYDGYEKNNGTPADGEAGAYDTLVDLVRWVIEADDAAFEADLSTWLVADEMRDWFILVTFAGGWDSGGKNSHLYFDPAAGDPWRFVPWDFNASWGQQWETSRVSSAYWDDFTWTNNVFYRMLHDADLADALWSRYREALAGPLDVEVLLAQARSWEAEIQPSAERTWRKWEGRYRSYSGWASTRAYYGDWTDPEGEWDYVHTWIEERWSVADEVVGAHGW